jgi:hypothetical protein
LADQKDDAIFALSSRTVCKPVGKYVGVPLLVDSVFQVFAKPKQGGIVPTDWYPSKEVPGVHGVGKVRYGVGGRNWGNFNWENLPPKGYPLALLRSWDIKGEALAWFRKQIWPTLGK